MKLLPNETLCWYCKNAVPNGKSGCDWSNDFQPCQGWSAKETIIMNAYNDGGSAKKHYTPSYKVAECPQFKEG